jgi:hypothetical protein
MEHSSLINEQIHPAHGGMPWQRLGSPISIASPSHAATALVALTLFGCGSQPYRERESFVL